MNRDINKRSAIIQFKSDKDMDELIGQISDTSYCNGYNLVLSACEKVLGLKNENYWNIVRELKRMESEADGKSKR